MNDGFEELLGSPIPEREHRQHKRWWIVGVGSVAAGAIWWASVIGGEDLDNVASVSTTGIPSATTTTDSTLTSQSVEFIAYGETPLLLYHPARIPNEWELCRQTEDIAKGDRFCPGGVGTSWLEVSVMDREEVRLDGPAVPGVRGAVWISAEDPTAMAVPAGRFKVVVVEAEGLSEVDMVAIALSIPLIGDRGSLYSDYETPLDLSAVSDDDLAALLESVDSEPRVAGRRAGEAQVYGSAVSLSVFYGDGPTVPDFAATLPFPHIVELGRPVVFGESLSNGRSYAIWDQRGHSWRLEGQESSEAMVALAEATIQAIEELGSV